MVFFLSYFYLLFQALSAGFMGSGVGWLHFSIFVLPSFSSIFCRNYGPQTWVDYIPTKTPHKQFTNCCEHLTIFTSPLPYPSGAEPGGVTGWCIYYGLSTSLKSKSVRACFGTRVGLASPRFFPEGVKAVAYILCTSSLLTPHETGGDNINQPEDWPNTELGF